jgi:mutator protein MutT
MKEILDIYNGAKQKTGKTIERQNISKLNKEEYIIITHCWIINSNGEILLTQRSEKMERNGKWEETHGAIKTGETSIEGMKRELKEELGIDVKTEELKIIKTYKTGNKIRDIYVIIKNIKIEDINFLDGEVKDCKYVTIEELKKMILRRRMFVFKH